MVSCLSCRVRLRKLFSAWTTNAEGEQHLAEETKSWPERPALQQLRCRTPSRKKAGQRIECCGQKTHDKSARCSSEATTTIHARVITLSKCGAFQQNTNPMPLPCCKMFGHTAQRIAATIDTTQHSSTLDKHVVRWSATVLQMMHQSWAVVECSIAESGIPPFITSTEHIDEQFDN
jgi:hypothetical protein